MVKLAPEPVIKTVPEDKPRGGLPVAASGTNSRASAEPTNEPPPEKKSFLSKLNPFKREPKTAVPPVVVVVGPAASSSTNVAASKRYQYLAPAVPAAGDRPAATRELVRGQEAQRGLRLVEAIQYFRRAAALDGSFFEAQYALGRAAFEAGDFKVAAAAWETALALKADSSDARYNFALTLKAAGHPQDAAEQLEKLLALHPDEARGHLTLGNLYAEQLRDAPRARKHYQQVLQLDPRNSQAQAIRYWLVANPG
jgi:tetratricopeptide (TPR) repeat protein